MKKRMMWIVMLAIAGVASAADRLVEWDLDGNNSTPVSLDSTAQMANMEVGTMVDNGQLVGAPRNSALVYRAVALATSQAEAISESSYLELTVSAGTGYDFSLTSLDLRANDYGSTGAPQYFIRSSVDGYAADLLAPTALWNGAITDTPLANLVLSGHDNLSTVTFRIYAFDDTGLGGNYNTFIGFGGGVSDGTTDLGVNGTVALTGPPPVAGTLFMVH